MVKLVIADCTSDVIFSSFNAADIVVVRVKLSVCCALLRQASLLTSVAIKRFCGDIPLSEPSDTASQNVSTAGTFLMSV